MDGRRDRDENEWKKKQESKWIDRKINESIDMNENNVRGGRKSMKEEAWESKKS